MARQLYISSLQIIVLLTYDLEKRPMSYSALHQKYPRAGFRLLTIESLEKKGFLTVKQKRECSYYDRYSISTEGKIFLENTFRKSSYYHTIMKAFHNRIRGADV